MLVEFLLGGIADHKTYNTNPSDVTVVKTPADKLHFVKKNSMQDNWTEYHSKPYKT